MVQLVKPEPEEDDEAEEDKLYLSCSQIAIAGEESSSHLIPAILSIIFQQCALQGWLNYPILAPPPLHPPNSLPDESGYRTDSGGEDDPSDHGSGSNYSDDPSSRGSGLSTYSSPDSKGKRVTRQSGQGDQTPKRQKTGYTEPVCIQLL